MRMTMIRRYAIGLAALLGFAGIAWGYPVGSAVSLEKLIQESDIIFKGTAVSSGPVQDEWFTPCQDFRVRETRFRVVSVIKGEWSGGELAFRHYDEEPQPQGRCLFGYR